MTDFRVNMYHTIHSSHALIAATTPSSSTRRPSPSTFFPVLHEEQEQEYSFSEPQHQLYQQSYTPSGSDHRYGVFNSGTTIGLMGCSTTASPPTAVANSTSTMGSSSSSLFSSNHTHSESEESLSTSSRTTNTDAGEEDDEDDDDDEYVDEDEEMEDLGSSIESLTSYYPQLLPDGTTTTTAAAATKNCNMTTTTSSASMALGELERNLVAAVDHWAATVTQSSSRQRHDGGGSGGGHRPSGSRYKGSFSRRLLPPTTTHSSSSSSSNSSSYVSLHQHHCSKKTKKTHNAPGTDDQSVCSIASAASSTSAMLGDSFQSTLRVSSPHPSSGHSTGHGVIKSTSQFGGCPPILPHQPQQQQQQTILPPLQSPAVEFQFLVKLRERTYSLCFPVWCPPSSSASSSSSSSFSATLSNPPNVSSGSSCGKRTHPWSSTTTTTMPQGLFSGTTATSTAATTTTTAATNTTSTATTSMPFLLPTAWQICAALSAKTNIPIHLLQLNDEDIPYSEMQKVLLHPRRRPSSSVHKTSHSHLFQQQQPPSFSGRGVGVGVSGRDDDSCHVFFLNAKLKVHIRGGKGGFGSLLKGQSKQAAAKTTLDFGACRDLSGRRLRHINDEIKLRKWREAMAAKARGETIDEEEHYRTKSGVRNWYLDLPNWALEAFSHKARRADERRIQREMFQKAQEEERQRLEELERKRARDRAIMAYVGPALQPTDSHSMEDAIAQGMMAKRRRTQQQETTTTDSSTSASKVVGEMQATSANAESKSTSEKGAPSVAFTHEEKTHAAQTVKAQDEEIATEAAALTAGKAMDNDNFASNLTADQAKEIVESTLKEEESWFCTLSGEFATGDTSGAIAPINKPADSDGTAPETQNSATSKSSSSSDQPQQIKKWELLVQSKSDFATGCVLLPDDINSVINDGGLIRGKWYYEVKLQETAGMAQIGWANSLFEPNCETGDGVGDDMCSYGYDGSRSLIFHAAASTTTKSTPLGETERSYGPTTPWKPFDVIGCMFDADDGHISFSINGKHLGVAYVVDEDAKNNNKKEQTNERQQTIGLFPAISLNQNEIVLVRAGPEFDFLPKGYKGIGEVLQDKIEVPVSTGTTDEEKSEGKNHKKVEGQEKVLDSSDAASTPVNDAFQLDSYNSIEELEKLGPDRLKHILISMSVKCGGTLNDRAKRLFSLKGLSRNEYPLKVRAKNFVA